MSQHLFFNEAFKLKDLVYCLTRMCQTVSIMPSHEQNLQNINYKYKSYLSTDFKCQFIKFKINIKYSILYTKQVSDRVL